MNKQLFVFLLHNFPEFLNFLQLRFSQVHCSFHSFYTSFNHQDGTEKEAGENE